MHGLLRKCEVTREGLTETGKELSSSPETCEHTPLTEEPWKEAEGDSPRHNLVGQGFICLWDGLDLFGLGLRLISCF